MAFAFPQLGRLLAAKPLEPVLLQVGEEQLQIVFRRHANARRLVLRLNPEGTGGIVTVPRGISRTQAMAFVNRSQTWLAARLKQRGSNILLRTGNSIPLRGEGHEIHHIASRRGTVTVDPVKNIIHVPGGVPHVSRRLSDWLKTLARGELSVASRKYAAAMGVNYRRVTIRDQRSRWGSCSASGDLSFSWRLILTPPYVLDYVAAHEVAHLRHMNHGLSFWRLVLNHCPDASRAKNWLKTHGQDVHRIIA